MSTRRMRLGHGPAADRFQFRPRVRVGAALDAGLLPVGDEITIAVEPGHRFDAFRRRDRVLDALAAVIARGLDPCRIGGLADLPRRRDRPAGLCCGHA